MTDKTFTGTFFSFRKIGKYDFSCFTISLIWTKRLFSKGQGINSCTACAFMVSFGMFFPQTVLFLNQQ